MMYEFWFGLELLNYKSGVALLILLMYGIMSYVVMAIIIGEIKEYIDKKEGKKVMLSTVLFSGYTTIEIMGGFGLIKKDMEKNLDKKDKKFLRNYNILRFLLPVNLLLTIIILFCSMFSYDVYINNLERMEFEKTIEKTEYQKLYIMDEEVVEKIRDFYKIRVQYVDEEGKVRFKDFIVKEVISDAKDKNYVKYKELKKDIGKYEAGWYEINLHITPDTKLLKN